MSPQQLDSGHAEHIFSPRARATRAIQEYQWDFEVPATQIKGNKMQPNVFIYLFFGWVWGGGCFIST